MKLPDNQCSDFIPAGYNRRDICSMDHSIPVMLMILFFYF